MNNKIVRIFAALVAALVAASVTALAVTTGKIDRHLASLSARLDSLQKPKAVDRPPLSETGEELRAQYRARLYANNPLGLTAADECSAYHIARQQSERLEMREEFIRQSRADNHSAQEIDRVIALDQQGDAPYALYVFMSCGNGEEPKSYTQYDRPKF